MKVISQMTTRSTRPMQRDLRVWILGRPHYGCAYNPWSQISGAAIDASLPQPIPCASAFFFLECGGLAAAFTVARPLDNLAVLRAIKIIFTQALTCFYILSNIRSFPGGSPVMPRTSRCFAETFLQLGGPDTLLSVEHFPLNLSFADFSFAHFQAFSVANFFPSNFEATCDCGSPAHNHRGNARRR